MKGRSVLSLLVWMVSSWLLEELIKSLKYGESDKLRVRERRWMNDLIIIIIFIIEKVELVAPLHGSGASIMSVQFDHIVNYSSSSSNTFTLFLPLH